MVGNINNAAYITDGSQASVDDATTALTKTSNQNTVTQLKLAAQASDRQLSNAVTGFAADSTNAAKDLLSKVRM